MSSDRPLRVVLAAAVLCAPGFGCFCFSTPMCSQVSGLTESDAVFLGRVVEVWPSHKALASEYQHLSFPRLKRLLLQRWHGVLSAEEEKQIRQASSRDAIAFRYALMQRVRVVVSEVFTGPRVREIYTNSSSCGYHFAPGRTYLVNAGLDGPRYWTGACSRTAQVESVEAVEDMNALRAWKSGQPLRRIYGHILAKDFRYGITVRLIHEDAEKIVLPDSDGAFSFDGLANTKYRLQVQDERGNGERVVDLSRLGCFEAMPWFDDIWRIAGRPVIVESSPAPPLLDPPPPYPPNKR